MEMKVLNGKNVYVAARSLTVKDNDGKTRGIVRNISFWKNLAPRVQFDMVHKYDFRKSGVWSNHELMCRIIFKDEKAYFFYFLKGAKKKRILVEDDIDTIHRGYKA